MELQLNEQQVAVAEQKRATWGEFGVGIFKTELSIQFEAKTVCDKLSELPVTIFDVPGAEERLAEGKRAQKTIEASRKEITSKLDDLTKRLMIPEKSLTDPINALSNEIIKIKKADEAEQRTKKAIADELVRCKEFYQNEAIRVDGELKGKVLDLISRCYNKALNENVSLDKIKDYIAQSKKAVTDKQFVSVTPAFHAAYITPEQVASIANEHFKLNFLTYVESFSNQIDEKFSDYDVAFNNKAEALALSQKEEQAKKDEIAQLAQQQQVANKIESASITTTQATFFTKALKRSFDIDMDDNVQSILTIMAAFSANLHLCMPHLKVTKWFSFTPAQAGKALAKVKCEDNEFEPVGIIFKEVEKL